MSSIRDHTISGIAPRLNYGIAGMLRHYLALVLPNRLYFMSRIFKVIQKVQL